MLDENGKGRSLPVSYRRAAERATERQVTPHSIRSHPTICYDRSVFVTVDSMDATIKIASSKSRAFFKVLYDVPGEPEILVSGPDKHGHILLSSDTSQSSSVAALVELFDRIDLPDLEGVTFVATETPMTEAELDQFRAWHNAWKPATRGLGPVSDKTISQVAIERSRAFSAVLAVGFAFMSIWWMGSESTSVTVFYAVGSAIWVGLAILPPRKEHALTRAFLNAAFVGAGIVALITTFPLAS